MNGKIHTTEQVEVLLKKARFHKKETKRLLNNLAGKKSVQLDELFQNAHEQVFNNTDCLVCANCCKTSSPIITKRDIESISSALRMKAGDFVRDYLRIDEDEDYVFQKNPCNFLNSDNTCSIYEFRPKACREYPHTNRKNMSALLSLTEANALVCPAVVNILDLISSTMPVRK